MAACCRPPRCRRKSRKTRGVPIGQGLHFAVGPFGVLDADRDAAIHRRDAAPLRRQARWIQALRRPPLGVPRDVQGDAADQHYPDFIVVDGKEGGTGAAPLEFVDHLGMPLREGLSFVHNALIGIGVRDRIRIGASGKIVSAFDIARAMALGADWCNAARGFMFALGCIQSQSCHTDRCPTGVATQDRTRQRALVVADNWNGSRISTPPPCMRCAEIVSAAGLDHPKEFMPAHFSRRVSASEVVTYAELYPTLKPGELLAGDCEDPRFREAWKMASAARFRIAAWLAFSRRGASTARAPNERGRARSLGLRPHPQRRVELAQRGDHRSAVMRPVLGFSEGMFSIAARTARNRHRPRSRGSSASPRDRPRSRWWCGRVRCRRAKAPPPR